MSRDQPAFIAESRRVEPRPQPACIRATRFAAIVTVLIMCSSSASAEEPVPRFFPTAPTAYGRPAWQQTENPANSRTRDTSNAEADIPQSHLLYSLHAARRDSVIQQAGGQIDPIANPEPPQQLSVPVTADGIYEPMDSDPRTDGNSLLEHIPASPLWTTELSLSSDLAGAWARLRDDARGVLHPNNVLILAMAGGGAVALRQNADERVRDYTARHPERWGEASRVLGELGYINVQVPALLGTYFWSVHTQDEQLHDLSATMISATTINGVSTLIIKAAANTDRPSDNFNGGQFGFPSYHSSSSFTIASVLDEYYGHRVGVPAYALAGMIAWSRIDERDHDLSDVLFGSALGFVIGKSVARHHLTGDSRVRILPWFEPIGGTSGVQFSMVW